MKEVTLTFSLVLAKPASPPTVREHHRVNIRQTSIDGHHGIDIHINITSRCFWANVPSSSSNFIMNSWKIQQANRSLQAVTHTDCGMHVCVLAQPYAPFSVLPASPLLCLSAAAWGEQTPVLLAWLHTPAEGKKQQQYSQQFPTRDTVI